MVTSSRNRCDIRLWPLPIAAFLLEKELETSLEISECFAFSKTPYRHLLHVIQIQVEGFAVSAFFDRFGSVFRKVEGLRGFVVSFGVVDEEIRIINCGVYLSVLFEVEEDFGLPHQVAGLNVRRNIFRRQLWKHS